MEDLKARVAYLRGLAEGMKLDSGDPQGKMLHEVIATLDLMADAIEELSAETEDIDEYLEQLDEDVRDLEAEVFGDEGIVEVTCPHCGETVCIDEELGEDESMDLRCPNCGELIYEYEEAEEEEGEEPQKED